LLKSSVSFLDFKAGVFAREGLLQTPEGKTRAVRSIVESISRMKDELKRNFYIKSVAEKYDIYESVLFRELESLLSRERGRRSTEEGTPSSQPQVTPVSSPRPAPVAAEGPVPAPERELLRVMLDYGQEIADLVFSHMEPAMFTHARARLVAEHIRSLAAGEKEWDATALLDRLPDDETRRFVADLVFAKYELSKNWEDYGVEAEPGDPRAVARDAIATMRVRDIDEQLREAFRHLKLAESKGESVRSYQEQIMRLQADRKNLLAWRTERGTRPS
jgi:DNA primase